MLPSCGAKTPIMSQECRLEHFSQGDIRSVVGTEIVTQRPDSGQKKVVWMAPNGKAHEVVESRLSSLPFDLSCHRKSANDLGHLDVEQVRRMEGLERTEQPRLDACASRRTQQNLK